MLYAVGKQLHASSTSCDHCWTCHQTM